MSTVHAREERVFQFEDSGESPRAGVCMRLELLQELGGGLNLMRKLMFLQPFSSIVSSGMNIIALTLDLHTLLGVFFG